MSNTDNYNNQIEEDSVLEDQTHCDWQADLEDEEACQRARAQIERDARRRVELEEERELMETYQALSASGMTAREQLEVAESEREREFLRGMVDIEEQKEQKEQKAARGKLKDISEDFRHREFDQEEGDYTDDDTPCCVGARLAHLLVGSHRLEGSHHHFIEGKSALLDLLGIKRGELTLTLWALGAGSQPFGTEPWSVHPSVVFDKLSKIENIKEFLRGLNLRGVDLRGAGVEGVDLRGVDLREADLRGANLRGVDLREANLEGANLGEADLRDADLEGVDLRKADLRKADLRKADLRGANLKGLNLRGVDLREADLREADMDGANLEGANLEGANLKRTET